MFTRIIVIVCFLMIVSVPALLLFRGWRRRRAVMEVLRKKSEECTEQAAKNAEDLVSLAVSLESLESRASAVDMSGIRSLLERAQSQCQFSDRSLHAVRESFERLVARDAALESLEGLGDDYERVGKELQDSAELLNDIKERESALEAARKDAVLTLEELAAATEELSGCFSGAEERGFKLDALRLGSSIIEGVYQHLCDSLWPDCEFATVIRLGKVLLLGIREIRATLDRLPEMQAGVSACLEDRRLRIDQLRKTVRDCRTVVWYLESIRYAKLEQVRSFFAHAEDNTHKAVRLLIDIGSDLAVLDPLSAEEKMDLLVAYICEALVLLEQVRADDPRIAVPPVLLYDSGYERP